MVCFRLLPSDVRYCVDKQSITIREILNMLGGHTNGGLIIVVNGKLVENQDLAVTDHDEIIVIQEFLGG